MYFVGDHNCTIIVREFDCDLSLRVLKIKLCQESERRQRPHEPINHERGAICDAQ